MLFVSEMWRATLIGDSLSSHLVPRHGQANTIFNMTSYDIKVHGIPGAKVLTWSSLSNGGFERHFGWLRTFRPDVILLAIGTTDLCDPHVTPDAVHSATRIVIDRLVNIVPFTQRVVILPILPRYATGPRYARWVRVDLDTFNNRVNRANELARTLASQQQKIIYWEHVHQHLRVMAAYVEDGVHMSESGKRRLVRSIKHALMRLETELVAG